MWIKWKELNSLGCFCWSVFCTQTRSMKLVRMEWKLNNCSSILHLTRLEIYLLNYKTRAVAAKGLGGLSTPWKCWSTHWKIRTHPWNVCWMFMNFTMNVFCTMMMRSIKPLKDQTDSNFKDLYMHVTPFYGIFYHTLPSVCKKSWILIE